MSVHYKFKSNLDYDTVTFDGLHISVADLKKSIMQQKKIGKSSDFDLQITNAQTKEVYEDDESLIPKNTSVIVARVPVVSSNKKSWERSDLPLPVDDDELSGQINFDKVVKSADLVNANASEEDKVKAMISQSSQEYDPSKYVKSRSMTGPLPPTYTCFRCGKQGHWIKNCPTNNIDIKRSTGIPRSFMVPVDGPEHKGALLTSSGEYAVPLIDHVAYKEVKKEKPPFVNVPEPEVEPEAQIPEELLCMVCRDLLQDAVLIPCCGNSFCDECVRQVLLDSDNHECPLCHETGISPDTVIPNRFLRTAVSNFRNETGYTRVKRIPPVPFSHPPHMDSPQPSPDSTVENQAPVADPIVEEAPVEEAAIVPADEENENVESESIQALESSLPEEPDISAQAETDENIERSNDDLQPGTPLADEPPVHNVPETDLNEDEQYSNQIQYDEENKFSYSHYYNENMDSDSRDEGHVSSSEISQISTIETITTRASFYIPRVERPPHSFHPQRPPHHGHIRDPDTTSLQSRRGGSSHTYRSKPQEWSKGSLTVLVERDYNRDRPDYRDRYDRRIRDRPAARFPQRTHNRYERQPRDSRFNQPEYHTDNRREYRDYSNNSELREDINYEMRTNTGEPTGSHPPRFNSPPVSERIHNKLNVVAPPPAQVLPRPHGMPPLTVAQPFPPQPPPPGSSPIDSSAQQPPPPGVGPLPPPPPTTILSDPPTSYNKPATFESTDKKPESRETAEMSIDARMDKFARELQRSRSRDRQQRSRSRSRSRDWSRSSSRTPVYRSSKSWSRSVSRTPSRSSRSHSRSSYFSRSRSRSRSYSSRSRSRSKSRSYSRSRSLSRSRTRSRSRSRIRHRRDSRERIRSPIISVTHSNSLSPKISRPQTRRSPFQVKRNYASSPYKPPYPTQYGGPPPPVPAAPPPPPPLPHNVIRPHPSHQIHAVQPMSHPPPVNHYNANEYHPERPSMSLPYDNQYHGYNSYQRPYVPMRYEPRNARFNKPPPDHQRHGEDMPLRIPGWIGDRRRNYKPGYQQQRESRDQQRRENPKVVRVVHQEIKTPYVCEIKEEPSLKKTEDKSLNKHKKHHHHRHHHPTKEVRKQENEGFQETENRSETPVNLIKVEVLPDAVVAHKTSFKTEGQVQDKLKKRKHKKHRVIEQTEKKKKPSKKEKSASVVSSEPESITKTKTKRKKNKVKDVNEVLKKKNKSKHSKVITGSNNEAIDRPENVADAVVIPEETAQTESIVDIKEEEISEPNIPDAESVKVEDGLNDNVLEIENVKEELSEDPEGKVVILTDFEKENEPEQLDETAENQVEETSLDGTDEANIDEPDDTTLHVEPPAISKWEREEYDEEIVRPQRRAIGVHKEEKESLSSDIIQRAEKAILQKPLKTAIVTTTHSAREKHSSKSDRKQAKHETSPEEKSSSERMTTFAEEYSELKIAAGIDCTPDESPTLQVTICTDKDKRSVHTKKKSESRSGMKDDSSHLKRLKLDRSKFLDKSADSGASQNSSQRTIVVAESGSRSSSKHSDWQRSFEDGEIKDAKYEKTKIIVKRSSDRGHQSFKERSGDHSVQKYSDAEFQYPKDIKRRKGDNSDRESKGVHDKMKFYGSHSLEDRNHSKKHTLDSTTDNQRSRVRSRSREKKDTGLKISTNHSRSRSLESTESFPSGQKQIVRKRHRSKCTAQIHKHRSDESSASRGATNEVVKTSRDNKKPDDGIRNKKDTRSDPRSSKRKDISQDESGFEPNYDGTSESDHSVKTGRSRGREKPESKRSSSATSLADPVSKRVKQDRPPAPQNLSDPQRNKLKHVPQRTIREVVSSSESSSYQSDSDSSASEGGKKTSKNKSPDSEHKHKHKKSKHKKHKKHKHKHKKKKSHKSKQKD